MTQTNTQQIAEYAALEAAKIALANWKRQPSTAYPSAHEWIRAGRIFAARAYAALYDKYAAIAEGQTSSQRYVELDRRRAAIQAPLYRELAAQYRMLAELTGAGNASDVEGYYRVADLDAAKSAHPMPVSVEWPTQDGQTLGVMSMSLANVLNGIGGPSIDTMLGI